MPVSDIARTEVVTVEPEASMVEAVERMRTESVGSVVVVDDGEPVGLVSDRDLAMLVLEGEIDPEGTAIAELLGDDLITVSVDAGLYDLVELMSEQAVRRVPVVEDGSLAGIVSLSDVVVLLGMELQQVGNAIRAVSPAYEQLATELYD